MSEPMRIRSIRQRKKLTIGGLAQASSIHKGHLSRIERGEKTPSLGTLMAIAKALGVEMAELFGEKAGHEEIQITRAVRRKRISDPGHTYAIEPILPGSGDQPLSLYLITPGPAFLRHDLPSHNGLEVLYVLRGKIEAMVGGRLMVLDTGDCSMYDAQLKHQLRRLGKVRADVLVIVSRQN